MSRVLALFAVAACSSPRPGSPQPSLPETPAFQWAHAVADPSYAVVKKPMAGAHARVAGPPGWACSADVTPGTLGDESGTLSCEHDGHRVQTLALCTTGPAKPSDCAWATMRVGPEATKMHVLGLACSSPGRRCGGEAFVTDYAHYAQADVPAKPRFTWTREGTATGAWSCVFAVDPQRDDAAGTHFEVGRLTCRAGADIAETAIVCAESPGGPPFCNAGSLRLGRADGGYDPVMITCRTSGATCASGAGTDGAAVDQATH